MDTSSETGERRGASILERLAVLEVSIKAQAMQLAHMDTCMESVKKTVWMGAGMVITVGGIGELVLALVKH